MSAAAPITLSKKEIEIPADFIAEVDAIIARYPVSKRSASLMLLHAWQDRFGYITQQAVEWVAAKLELQPVNIYELVTFYPMFRLEKFGRTHIRVCRTLSCALAGSYELHKKFCEKTNAQGDPHGPMHSPDGEYTIEFVECLAACGSAPVCMVGDQLFESVKTDEQICNCLKHGA